MKIMYKNIFLITYRPDINAIRALPSVPVAVSRVSTEERDLPRQGSLADGEGIKIVIHDVDSDLGECTL